LKLIKNKKYLLLLIFIAALLVRLGTIVLLESYRFKSEQAFGYGYGSTAKYVAVGEGFSKIEDKSGVPRPTAISPPGYVYLLALIFSIFGVYSVQSAIVIEFLQSLTAAFTCLAFYHLGRRYNEAVGLLAALAAAVYPPSILFSVMRISPILLVVLLLALIIHYMFKIQEHWRYRDAVICGVLMAVNALMEPVVIIFYVAACIWLLLWSSQTRSQAVKSCLIMGLVCIVCILPWTIRNYLVFKDFVLIKSSMGKNLLEGNRPSGSGIIFTYEYDDVFSPEELAGLESLNEVERYKVMQRKAIEFIKADPGRFLQLTLKRIFYYWSLDNPYRRTPYDKLRIITYGPVLLLAIIGAIWGWKHRKETSMLLFLLLSYPLPYYITQVTIYRYRYGAEAFLLILASYAAVQLVKKHGSARLVETLDKLEFARG
jgi:4-amino-4-deoxy-L-arabinose transferase-like glycosyltransferase